WDVHVPELLEMLAFPGLHRIAEKYWRIELEELRRSFFKSAFVKALQRLIPEVRDEDLVRARSGVRAMACQKDGQLVDDFLIRRSEGIVHVLNAPSPAATASLSVGNWIADVALG
ncbi:MAG: FAD-dependent oxidoreductase, partial [Saprospiraceae bacterium]|nr:FAD-dependent oxidoreductase [Saprospiraceae bacterium]